MKNYLAIPLLLVWGVLGRAEDAGMSKPVTVGKPNIILILSDDLGDIS